MKRYPLYKDSKVKWIGNVPEHWKRMRYKDILIPKDVRVGNYPSFTLLSLTKQGVIVRDVSEGKGKFPKDFDTYKVVVPDDFILCLFDVDETPRTVGVAHNHGMITGAYDIFKVHRANLQYIYYLYLSFDDKKCLKPLYKGLRKTIPLPRLLSSYFFLPPEPEQRAIVAFLDRAVEKIDGYIAAKEAEIEKLGTLKQSVIAKAVTQGLNPDVPMKDSGIPWLGNVPEHWGITTAKHILKKLERPTVFEAPVLICSNHGEVFYRGERRIGLISLTEHDYQGVEPGDLLIHGMDTWHGAIAISNLSGKCTSVVHVCSSSQNKTFVMYYLQALAIKKVFKAITNGVRQNTSDFRSWNEAGKITVLVPPLDEQNNIVEFISSKIQQSNEYITGIRAQIEKLKVYKQRLISDVVTGKICVCDDFEQAN